MTTVISEQVQRQLSEKWQRFSGFLVRINRTDLKEILTPKTPIAFFSAEFGGQIKDKEIDYSYAGGLGILAEDIREKARQLSVPFRAIGLAYPERIAQVIEPHDQINDADGSVSRQFFYQEQAQRLPFLESDDYLITGKVNLRYQNVSGAFEELSLEVLKRKDDDSILLYNENLGPSYNGAGESDQRLLQFTSLGFGGYQVLRDQKERGEITEIPMLHLNESACALAAVATLDDAVNQGQSVDYALDSLKKKTLLTNHTLLPYADAVYDREQCNKYMFPNIHSSGVKAWLEQFIDQHDGKLPMLDLAMELAGKVNGVSQLHSRLAFEAFADKYSLEAMPPVTNGIDLSRWAPDFSKILTETGAIDRFGLPPSDYQERIKQLSGENLWELKQEKRKSMRDYLRTRKDQTGKAIELNDQAVVATFARRFVEYKRHKLILEDMDQLKRLLVDNPDLHVMMAGKIHPNDVGGKKNLTKMLDLIEAEGLTDRIHWIQDYDIELGKQLTTGSDIWLNAPKRGEEACGTSGMKAQMNAAILVSTADGYTDEMGSDGYIRVDGTPDGVDELRSYYTGIRKALGLLGDKSSWIKMVKSQYQAVLPIASGSRMMGDYLNLMF